MLPWKVFAGKGFGFQVSQNINFQFWHKHICLGMFSLESRFALLIADKKFYIYVYIIF